MATFCMFGKYSVEAVKDISAARTKKATELIGNLGGKIHTIYTLLGPYDIVLIVDLPDTKAAMKASLALTKMSNIAFTTAPAVSVEEFDTILTS